MGPEIIYASERRSPEEESTEQYRLQESGHRVAEARCGEKSA